MTKSKEKQLCVRLSLADYNYLTTLADGEMLSLSAYIRRLIKRLKEENNHEVSI